MPVLFQVIEWFDESGREMVHRVPESGSAEFKLGDQLVVRESQRAVFFRDGKALDVFGPGRHTLTTANLPVLSGLLGMVFSGQSPFRAEVVFVNMREFIDMKWGTSEPIAFRDREIGIVRLRAFGTYSVQIADPQLFVNNVVGTQGYYTTNAIENYLRSIIINRLIDFMGEKMTTILDLPRYYDEIAAGGQARVRDDFNNLGLSLKAMYIGAITPPEEVQKFIDERSGMGVIGDMNAYLRFQAARGINQASQGGGGGEGGNLTGAGLGLGAGVGMGSMMAGMMGQMAQGMNQPQQAPATPKVICPNCKAQADADAKFCPNCGEKLAGTVNCSKCGTENDANSKFCRDCGNKLAG